MKSPWESTYLSLNGDKNGVNLAQTALLRGLREIIHAKCSEQWLTANKGCFRCTDFHIDTFSCIVRKYFSGSERGETEHKSASSGG